jgi:hypothetical protein
MLTLLAHPVDFARCRLLAAVEPEREFAAAGADQAVEPDDLASLDRQRHILEARAGEPADLDDVLADGDLFLVVDLLDRAVDHQRDQLIASLVSPIRRVPTWVPSRSTETRSASSKTSSMRWLI